MERKDNEISSSKLNSGLKSIVAFWCLYRAPESGTASIDQKIRNLLREDFSFFSKKGTTRSIDVSELRHKLEKLLKDRDHKLDKDLWAEKVQTRNIYKNSRSLTRLTLLAAHHGHKAKGKQPNFVKENASIQTLTLKAWVSDEYREVEHICPQSEEKTPTNGWEKDLKDDPNRIHRLGNLLLANKDFNQIKQPPMANKTGVLSMVHCKTTTKRKISKKKHNLDLTPEQAVSWQLTTEIDYNAAIWIKCLDSVAEQEGEWKKRSSMKEVRL